MCKHGLDALVGQLVTLKMVQVQLVGDPDGRTSHHAAFLDVYSPLSGRAVKAPDVICLASFGGTYRFNLDDREADPLVYTFAGSDQVTTSSEVPS